MNVVPDSHAHLADPAFDADRDEVIARAREAGVEQIVVIGTGSSYEEIGAALRIAEPIDGAYAAAGIHPHEASKFPGSDLSKLRGFAHRPKFIGLGEIGLDYHYGHSPPGAPREAQRQMFIRQLELARELKLPVIIHCRDAWRDLRQILSEHWRSSGLGGILHCFTGEPDDAFELIDCGFMVSFAGNLTFKNAEALRDVARQIPADALLTETDSPYLAPVPHRGRRNEPAFVREVLRQLASLRAVSEEVMSAQVLENFCRFLETSGGCHRNATTA